jgi:hypothetical protein
MSKNYDITPLMAPYLDVHMVSPLLDFLRELEVYDAKLITKEKIRSVNRTNMTELVEDEYLRFPEDAELQAEFALQKPLLEARMEKSFESIDNEPEVRQAETCITIIDTVILNIHTNNAYIFDTYTPYLPY